MKKENIEQILDQGENSSVEFKSDGVRPESLAKEMAAFSNSGGGVILIGIADNREIEGVDTNFNYEEWIANIARNNVIPRINPVVELVEIDSVKIVCVEVPKGKDLPYTAFDNKYYIRVGSTIRTASQRELMRLFQESGVFHFDLTGVDSTSISDLNLAKIDSYFSNYDIEFSDEDEEDKVRLLKNTDILNESGKASVAGLLVFGINPQKHLRNASISFAHFQGNDITDELIDKQNVENTLDYQIDTVAAVIKNNILTPSVIEGQKRKDLKPLYKDKVFRELVTNACVHRNYSISGSKTRIFMFFNRIEFISPGRLPNTISIEKLRAGVSYSVNPVIVKFMENLRYIDKLGRGLPMVCREAEKLGRKVEFEEIGEEFKVTLFLE